MEEATGCGSGGVDLPMVPLSVGIGSLCFRKVKGADLDAYELASSFPIFFGAAPDERLFSG